MLITVAIKKATPVVVSSTGVIPEHLFSSLKAVHMPKYTIQKSIILNICCIAREF